MWKKIMETIEEVKERTIMFDIHRGFCMETCEVGWPMTYTGQHEGGLPNVVRFNGENYCGVSNEKVVENIGAPMEIMKGSLINVIRTGNVRLPRQAFKNPEDADYNRYIKPTKNGWKIQKKKTKKSRGIITLTGKMIEVNLF